MSHVVKHSVLLVALQTNRVQRDNRCVIQKRGCKSKLYVMCLVRGDEDRGDEDRGDKDRGQST